MHDLGLLNLCLWTSELVFLNLTLMSVKHVKQIHAPQISHPLVDETPLDGTQSRTNIYTQQQKGGWLITKQKFKAQAQLDVGANTQDDFTNRTSF